MFSTLHFLRICSNFLSPIYPPSPSRTDIFPSSLSINNFNFFVSAVLICSRQFQIFELRFSFNFSLPGLVWYNIILSSGDETWTSLVSSAFSDRAATLVVCNEVHFSVLFFMLCGFYLRQINTINMDQTLSCRVRYYTFDRGTVAIILKFYSFFLLREFGSSITYPTLTLWFWRLREQSTLFTFTSI